jgi:hypothetical protein
VTLQWSFKKTTTGLFIILSMVFLFATLAYLTVAKCATNCTQHPNFSDSCISEGSLYCCRASTGSYAHFSCGGYQECELDNQECGRYMLGSEVVGGVMIIAVGFMIYRAICSPPAPKKDTQVPSAPQNPLAAHLITYKDEPETTGSERSSNDRSSNYPDHRSCSNI